MKLKNRFIIIAFGTIFIPFLISGLIAAIFIPDAASTRLWKKGVSDIDAFIETARTEEDILQFASELSEQFFIIILDDNSDIFYQQTGNSQKNGQDFHHDESLQLVIIREIKIDDGGKYSLYLMADTLMIMPFAGFITGVLFLLILAGLLILTLRSINKSIHQLDKGTRRIASGDLDTPIIIQGDDIFVNLADSFDTMRKKVKEEYDRRTRLFTGVSHDLKTPLASITGYTEVLLDGLPEDEETRNKYLKIIHTKGKLLDRRIAQLIQYVKLSNDEYLKNMVKQPLLSFVQDFVDLQQDEASLLGYEFEPDVDAELNVIVPYDYDLLLRALENLMQNCHRYGDLSKPIKLVYTRGRDGDESVIFLSLINYYKTQISREVLDHMFEPFYRGDQSRHGEGFGLGLASVKSIIENHGWKIKVLSDNERSTTTFRIIIPNS